MEVEEVVKSGSLYVPPQGFLKQKKSWNKRYYVLYKNSYQGIQRLEVFDNEDQYLKQNKCLRIIPLTDCLKVSPSPQKQQSNVFEIRTKENSFLFSSDTFNEMTEWLNCLQMIAFGVHNHNQNSLSKGFPLESNGNQFNNNSNAFNSNHLSDSQSEDNLLYSSVDSPDIYRVRLIDSETSIRCGLRSGFDSNFTLIITSINISLAEEGRVLLTWPYRHIRRYGCTKEGFSLEAGRKCASGEGLFSFITKDGNFIFQSVATHVNSLKASRNLTDEPIPGVNMFGANNLSPKLKPKEMTFPPLQSYLNYETKPSPPLPSTSPPNLSSTYLLKTNYFATNSSLLPSTKIPDSAKRHSIQPPKSPQMIPKQPLTRVTSVNTNSIISPTDTKTRASPPISKPPRKIKDSKTSDSEEPMFVSREEILGMNSVTNNFNLPDNYKPNNDEILYDEPGDPTTQTDGSRDVQQNKTPFCPSPPPVTHTVSKLTSVLKMMFSGNMQNQIHPKNRDTKQVVSSQSSTGSVSSNDISFPNKTSAPLIPDNEDLGYAEVMDIHKTDDNKKFDLNSKRESSHYSKILNNKLNENNENFEINDFEHQYANVKHRDSCDLNKSSDNSMESTPKTEHYVQNDCEYARVVKRSMNNTNNTSV